MSVPTLDPRLFAHLQREGHLTSDRVTKRPTHRQCQDCGASVLAAIADETAGRYRVEVHPTPVTALGELQALVAGVATFEVEPSALWWRDPQRIAGHPASVVTVHHEHQHRSMPGIDYRPIRPSRASTPITHPTAPPF